MTNPRLATMLTLLLTLAQSPALAQGPTQIYYLLKGQRIKVDAKTTRGNQLYASSIEIIRAEDDDFEIEGRVRKLDIGAGTFQIHQFTFTTYQRTEIHEETEAHVREFSDLRNGMRVKVEAKRFENDKILAKEIRLLPNNGDTDVEIESEIQSVDVGKSTFSIVGTSVLVTGKTEISGLDALSSDLLSDAGSFSTIRRDDDEPLIAPLKFGRVYIGGKAGARLEMSRDRDLDDGEADSVNRVSPEMQVEVSAPLTESIEAYARFNFRSSLFPQSAPALPNEGQVEVREAYLYVENFLHRRLGLQVGRQRFRDKREWVYDDRLDAVRLHYFGDNWKTEVAVAKTIFGATGSRSDQLYLIARGEVRLPKRNYLAGYWMKRNDTSNRDEDPVWFGVSARGRITNELRYWGELAQMRGRREDRKLRGWGTDVGGSYQLPGSWRPTVALGYAYGSGDNNLDDGVDGNFKQTQLNDNSYRIGGLKRYRYYGVALEPELSNLKIRTVDFGIRPSDSWSLNLVYHDYVQAQAFKKVGDLALSIDPRGRDPRFGKEFDAVFALRRFSRVDVNLLFGVFQPGPAFEGPRSPSLVFSPELRYYF